MHVVNKQCVLGTVGVVLVVFGGVFAIFWLDIFNNNLLKEMTLGPSTKAYNTWKNPPIPMTLDIYFYNWTNPEQINNHSSKPILVELGPYVFVEKPDKIGIQWNPENSTVKYFKKSDFYFDEKRSNGSLSDMITSVNMVALAGATKTRFGSYLEKKQVSVALQIYEEKISITKNVSEFLFDGYEDEMVNLAIQLGEEVPFDRIGWFVTRNGTANVTGEYTVHTGVEDISKFGVIDNWNGQKTTVFKDHCGMINGSAGEFYPPHQTKEKPITFFTPDLCRSISFDFEEEVTVHDLNGYKYSGGEKMMDNGTLYPENSCFCTGECTPSGVLNVSECRFGAPVFMSFPHYYAADPYFLDMVEGLSPSKEKHQFSMTLEPQTGLVLDVAARFQINLLMRPMEHINLYQNVPYIFIPIIWFEQKVTITPEMASEIQIIFTAPKIGFIVLGVFITIGIIMIVWVPLRNLCQNRKNHEVEANTDVTAEASPFIDRKLKNSEIIISSKNGDINSMKDYSNSPKKN